MFEQVEEFIAQLGIYNMTANSENELPAKPIQLKTAKVQQHEQPDDDMSSECIRKRVLDKKKKGNRLQDNEVSSSTTPAVDLITKYQPRKYLLIKTGEKWYNERVSHSSFHG